MFKLTRYFAVVALGAVLLASLGIGLAFRFVAEKNIYSLGERQNEILGKAIANAMWPNIKMFVNSDEKKISGFDRDFIVPLIGSTVRPLLAELPVVKIKIFTASGLTLYSSNDEDIGELKSDDYPDLVKSKQGHVVSEMDFLESFQGSSGELRNVYIVSSYLPLRESPTEPVKAIIETYADVTPHVLAMNETRDELFRYVFGGLFAVYLIMLAFVRRADVQIKQRARDREAHVREIKRLNESIDQSLQDATRDLVIARDQAVRANETKSSFLANVSHELRTPLNAIIGYSEFLLESHEGPRDAPILDDIRKIQQAGRNLLLLVNDILDLSKIEAGKMELQPVEIKLEQLLMELRDLVRPLVDARGNTLEIRHVNTVKTIFADRLRLRQVLLNLIGNAAKFTDRGDIRVDVRANPADPENSVEITVSDTGIGMSESELAKLFEAFTQANSSISERYGGTGLGLAISQKLCKMMGGNLSAKSSLGDGTAFTVHLPAHANAAAELRNLLRQA